tara:strand:- start:221 stop:1030 length:810 start_codon:yes stop_codon:yes gene_type:complete
LLIDFLLFRHLRVARARAMRQVHKRRALQSGAVREPVTGSYGVPMWPHWSDRTFAYCHYATYGNYLPDLLAAIDKPFAFIDIGANQGLFSLVAARNPNCQKIVALEPVPTTYAKLQANLALNGLDDRADAINAALADHAGSAEIALKPEHSGAASLREGTHFGGAKQTIKLFSIAEFDPHLPANLPLFVKIDIEGYEPLAIRQLLKSAHAGRIMALFYEMDERWSDAEDVRTTLYEAGFTKWRKFGIGRHYDMLAQPEVAETGSARRVA